MGPLGEARMGTNGHPITHRDECWGGEGGLRELHGPENPEARQASGGGDSSAAWRMIRPGGREGAWRHGLRTCGEQWQGEGG